MTILAWFPRTTDEFNTWASDGVYRDFPVVYSITDTVTSDFILRYNTALSGAWGTLEVDAEISLTAERNFQVRYGIETSVSADFSILYSMDGQPLVPVSRDFILIFTIDSEIASFEVQEDFPIFYALNGVAIRDFDLTYSVSLTSPPDDGDTAWEAVPLPTSSWTQVPQPTTGWTNG